MKEHGGSADRVGAAACAAHVRLSGFMLLCGLVM